MKKLVVSTLVTLILLAISHATASAQSGLSISIENIRARFPNGSACYDFSFEAGGFESPVLLSILAIDLESGAPISASQPVLLSTNSSGQLSATVQVDSEHTHNRWDITLCIPAEQFPNLGQDYLWQPVMVVRAFEDPLFLWVNTSGMEPVLFATDLSPISTQEPQP